MQQDILFDLLCVYAYGMEMVLVTPLTRTLASSP